MGLQTLADPELQTLGEVVAATALLLDRVRSASTLPERDALMADFNEAIRVLRADLARHDQDADAMIAGALVRVARLLVPEPAVA
jgi:hypothetical protein